MDPTYQPSLMERRTLFGLQLEQKRNDAVVDPNLFSNIVSQNKEVIQIVNFLTAFFLTAFLNPLSTSLAK